MRPEPDATVVTFGGAPHGYKSFGASPPVSNSEGNVRGTASAYGARYEPFGPRIGKGADSARAPEVAGNGHRARTPEAGTVAGGDARAAAMSARDVFRRITA